MLSLLFVLLLTFHGLMGQEMGQGGQQRVKDTKGGGGSSDSGDAELLRCITCLNCKIYEVSSQSMPCSQGDTMCLVSRNEYNVRFIAYFRFSIVTIAQVLWLFAKTVLLF